MAGVFLPVEIPDLAERLDKDFARFHWSVNKNPTIRLALLKVIDELNLDVRATVTRHVIERYQERGRGQCFGALVVDFGRLGGKTLTIDKRDKDWKNLRDTTQIEHLVKDTILPADFRHSFKQPSAEPILRIADAVAGAVQAQFTQKDAQYVVALARQLRLRILP
jgi:hypothetical protein